MLTSVGLPQRPDSAGKGGRSRGIPRRPSTEAISPVSSPQTNAPAPSTTLRRNGKLEPSKASPSQPRFSSAASAARTRRDRQRIFVADIEKPLVRADRHRGQRQPFDDAKRKRLENEQPVVSLQITYLTSPGCRRTARHFCPLGNPAPPRPRKPDFSMVARS